jgi:hypothetical protein
MQLEAEQRGEMARVVCVKFSKRGFVVWRFGGFRRFMGRV